MGDFVVAIRVYRGRVVSIHGKETLVDLIELDMLDFDVILVMDWIHSCYTSLDFRTYKVIFKFPNEPIIEWEGSFLVPKRGSFRILKTRRQFLRGVSITFSRLKILTQRVPICSPLLRLMNFMMIFLVFLMIGKLI